MSYIILKVGTICFLKALALCVVACGFLILMIINTKLLGTRVKTIVIEFLLCELPLRLQEQKYSTLR